MRIFDNIKVSKYIFYIVHFLHHCVFFKFKKCNSVFFSLYLFGQEYKFETCFGICFEK